MRISVPWRRIRKQLVISTSWLVVLALLGSSAWAKPVSIRWKKIKGAIRYELQVKKDGSVVSKQMLSEPGWKGELDYGVYSYEIRAYDRVKRAGSWSPPRALVVMPSAPKPSLPEDGAKTVFYTPSIPMQFKWTSVPGATRYFVEVKREGSVVYSGAVHDTELQIPGLKDGAYSWQVAAILDAQGRAPASLHGRRWEGKYSELSEFKLDHEELDAPRIHEPEGRMAPPNNARLLFRWSPVEGAKGYELILMKKASANGRTPATVASSRFVTKGGDNTRLTLRVEGEGQYAWQVRALASIGENHLDDSPGSKSTADFTLDSNSQYFEGAGYFAFSLLLAPYTYKVSGPETHFSSIAASSAATAFRASGEYWAGSQWGISGMFQDTFFGLAGSTFDDKDIGLSLKYRANLSDGIYPWTLMPELGAELRQYAYVIPSASGQSVNSSGVGTTYGPGFGLDLRKQFSDRLSIGAKFRYYFPVAISISGASGSVDHSSSLSNQNMSLGIQSLYWLDQRWGVGGGFFIDKNSIAVSAPANGFNTDQEHNIVLNASYFFGSIIWRFDH